MKSGKRHKTKRLIVATTLLTLCSTAAQAQDADRQRLERQLQERDRVILELLERVEALERRVGVPRIGGATQGHEADAGGADAQRAGRAPGAVVVADGAAERALERSLTREGALLLPPGILEVEPGVTFARREDTAPGFVMSGGLLQAGETERNANRLTGNLALRLGLPWDAQLELGFPYRWREVETVTQVGFAPTAASRQSGSGPGDLRVGVAKTLLREDVWRPDLVGRITWDTDSGATSDHGVSLGGGFHELRGSLSAIKRQDPIAFVGGLSYEHVFEKDQVQPGATYGVSFGSLVALSPETSLRFVFSGAYQDATAFRGRGIDGSDRVIGLFEVGGSALLAPGTLLNLSAGIGLTDDADDFSIMLSLPIRFGTPLF